MTEILQNLKLCHKVEYFSYLCSIKQYKKSYIYYLLVWNIGQIFPETAGVNEHFRDDFPKLQVKFSSPRWFLQIAGDCLWAIF
jgi:hypothetical protein